MIPSPCGIFDCEKCEKGAELNCPGCLIGNDYLERKGHSVCPVFDCIRQNSLSSCSECTREDCEHYRGPDAICFLCGANAGKPWPTASSLKESIESAKTDPSQHISDRTVMRLRWYLLILEDLARRGVTSVSSREIAEKVGATAALVRKDLSYFGDFGTRSFGYNVRYLQKKITEILHLNQRKHIVWLGAKRLDENVAVFKELPHHNCHIAAVVDVDESKIGARVQDLQVMHISSLPQVVANLNIDAAVLALPPEHSQMAIQALADVGVKAVLNLSPTLLDIPRGMNVRNIDITGELVALSFYCHRVE